jgi:hypothetical protein
MEEIFSGGSSNPMKMRSRTYDEEGSLALPIT